MGKEKFVRSKPHVNDEPGESLSAGTSPSGESSIIPTDSFSLNFAKVELEGGGPEPDAGKLSTAPATSGDRPMESLSLNFGKIEYEQTGGPSTLAALEPDGPGSPAGPDSLAGLGEVEDHAMLLPAIQKVREAAARMESEDPLGIEADL